MRKVGGGPAESGSGAEGGERLEMGPRFCDDYLEGEAAIDGERGMWEPRAGNAEVRGR